MIKQLFPNLELTLRKAGKKESPQEYTNKYSKYSLLFAFLFSAFFLIVILEGINNRGWPTFSLIFLVPLFFALFFAFLLMFFSVLRLTIFNRRYELESDLLYSSRYLLLKLESGAPLLNVLIDVSNLHTNSSKFFREIVSDIYLGTSIEEAVGLAIKYSPSPAYTKILEEIKNSLKTGADIEKSMKSTLESLTKEHLIQIKAYGKKLSPVSMMYMIIGTILPALGSAMIVVATGFIELPLKTSSTMLVFLVLVLLITQFFFILLFKALKPQVMA
ncbi:type II secretion system F family protein [Candidatus Woesearchaeota archaeon]|nr:type II secretion system F family protein [Candidatus Woesearchaeota archaeon]